MTSKNWIVKVAQIISYFVFLQFIIQYLNLVSTTELKAYFDQKCLLTSNWTFKVNQSS